MFKIFLLEIANRIAPRLLSGNIEPFEERYRKAQEAAAKAELSPVHGLEPATSEVQTRRSAKLS